MQDVTTPDSSIVLFASGGSVVSPSVGLFSAGYVSGENVAAEHLNWYLQKLTQGRLTYDAATLSILAELKSVLTAAGMTPNGSLTNQIQTALDQMYKMPVGAVIAFDGAWTDNVTIKGWYACVLANAGLGCPNLVDRFLLGKAVAGSGALGGSNSHTIAAAELPLHTHDLGEHTHSTPNHSHSLSNHTHDVVLGSHSHNLFMLNGGGSHHGPADAAAVTQSPLFGPIDNTDLGTKTSGGPSNNATDSSGGGTTAASFGSTANGGFANSAIDMHPANYSVVWVKRVS